ncbi:MAG: ATP-binding protein, partial [Bacteroides sp.]|nr:ATP-binding protein [Bacteroides sp.]
MAVLQDIERRIEELSPSGFQQLCDAYLLSKNRGLYSAFIRKGSMLGKDKTIKGTPDTVIYTHENRVLLIEYSTNSTAKAKKLIDDIDKCITNYKAKISQVESIILFANYRLDEQEENDIQRYASSKKVNSDIYNVGRLAIDITTNHYHLISTYLDIPVDTGQVVSLETFVREYQRQSAEIATPLDNPFLFREAELTAVIECLNESDIVILKGSPGVGKTKLALESIGRYQKEHPSYSCFAISYKYADLLTDLTQNIHADANCILFLDDANTVGHFKQVLGFYKKYRKWHIKLLITVRDYALGTIRDWCYPYQPKEVLIETFNAEKIEAIVSATYGINNHVYLDTICRLSNGNPRIAMMLAKLAAEEQTIQSLNNVAQVFDLYYSNIYNNGLLTEDILKVAGLIA